MKNGYLDCVSTATAVGQQICKRLGKKVVESEQLKFKEQRFKIPG